MSNVTKWPMCQKVERVLRALHAKNFSGPTCKKF